MTPTHDTDTTEIGPRAEGTDPEAGLADEIHRDRPVASADRVWSASSLENEPTDDPRRGPRRGTVTWGVVLCLIAGLLAAVGLGLHVDIVALGIIVLAGAGIALLAMALVPSKRTQG
ncbi:hypothetical protein [Actinomyces howellii]|uniref:Uncharacterized protein n=1 Tax=Actinomyces howellii TaxID=52771 RepID=A0A3S4R0C6_9ACTO|nr:hypothetical protein [Actinomyces howellii]VEG27375.1 Uncharacterised protein [Actinomyces howellii]